MHIGIAVNGRDYTEATDDSGEWREEGECRPTEAMAGAYNAIRADVTENSRLAQAAQEAGDPASQQMGPDRIVRLTGLDLDVLKSELAGAGLHTLSVCIDRSGFKWKPNEASWSPPVGGLSYSPELTVAKILGLIRERMHESLELAEKLMGGPDADLAPRASAVAYQFQDLLASLPGTPEEQKLIEKAQRLGIDF